MNCEAVRKLVLASEDPARIPKGTRGHLNSCRACRAWLMAFRRLEAAAAVLPVPPPPGGGPAALVARFRAAVPAPQPTRPPDPDAELRPVELRPLPVPAPASVPSRPRRSRKDRAAAWWPAGLGAAALLGLAVWLGGPRTPPGEAALPADPLLDAVVRSNADVAKARGPADRLDALAGLAEGLQDKAVEVAKLAPADDVDALAKLFVEVVRDGLTEQARDVMRLKKKPRDEAVKDVVERLTKAEQGAERVAAESLPSSASFKAMAAEARNARVAILQLAAVAAVEIPGGGS